VGRTISLTAKDGHALDAYRADPSGKARGALVVIQEIFGVNHHIRATCDRFAAAGYIAIAPALFDRFERGIELGYDQKGIDEGRGIRGKIALEQSLSDTQAAIDYAQKLGKVGITGYCFGGSVAFLAATRLSGLQCAIGYYGGMIAQFASEKPKVPTILHFGDQDQSIPMSDVEKVKAARPEVTSYVYHAGHGFSCDERGSYNAEAHHQALDRTLKFLAQHVG
jgi:carboxymethylenebutenolidase